MSACGRRFDSGADTLIVVDYNGCSSQAASHPSDKVYLPQKRRRLDRVLSARQRIPVR